MLYNIHMQDRTKVVAPPKRGDVLGTSFPKERFASHITKPWQLAMAER